MKPKNCLIFGASGQIGRNLIRKLTKNNYKVTAVTRNLHQKAFNLKTQANPGYMDIVETSIFNEKKIRELIKKCDVCINLVGILYEKGKVNTFKNIHENFPLMLSVLCNEYKVKQFIHLSALGIEQAIDSNYALSKVNGENLIRENFNYSTILKPSVVYSVDDNFTTNFMTLLNRLPIFPLYYNGQTNFMPIYCSDLTNIIFNIIHKEINSKTIECIGPEKINLKNILNRLLNLIDKKRLLLPMPLILSKLSSSFFELFPKPLITNDQLRLLKYHNVQSGKYKTNFDIDLPSYANFDLEVEKYCHMWKDAGEFSKKRYKNI
ncbi:complex I NDUFA9 subunit family protein [Candidatus Pelagibacter sp.]|nr:complex I NDUFA9 subunit family protein [Candidatus Pelagibacter sp.]